VLINANFLFSSSISEIAVVRLTVYKASPQIYITTEGTLPLGLTAADLKFIDLQSVPINISVRFSIIYRGIWGEFGIQSSFFMFKLVYNQNFTLFGQLGREL
jgi:hypothetical protein